MAGLYPLGGAGEIRAAVAGSRRTSYNEGKEARAVTTINPVTTAPAIAVSGLTKVYKGVTAVDHIAFSIASGSITGLLGGNGAGKTTTIGMLLGLIQPSAGEIHVLGTDMAKDRHRVLHRINFESPYVALPGRLTVRQNLRIFGRLYGIAGVERRILALADELDLADFLDREAGKLSAGQKTRVAVAKALINAPELLLLDEPTASLDPDTGDWIRTRLEAYRQARGATILLASHNMPEVERLCDDVIMMKAGRVVDRGAPADLVSRYGRTTLEDVFLDVARGRGHAAELARSP
jgi:ABC-2 type transport system ATP-binding protein